MTRGRPGPGDAGAAVVEFVAVVGMLTLMFLAVLQLALTLHIRNTLVDCAAEGARLGGLADRTPADGAVRTRELIGMSLGTSYAAQVSSRQVALDGVLVVEVRVVSDVPALGLIPTGRTLTVTGHGLVER